MTAINIVLRGDTAHVLSDGAGYTTDGAIVSFQQKVFPLATLNAAFAIRGSTWVWAPLLGFINELHDTFDDLVGGLPETWARCRAAQSDFAGQQWDEPHEVLVVGISEARGLAEAYVLVNTPAHGLPVATMIPLAEGLVIPGEPSWIEGLAARGLDPTDEAFDMEVDGLRLLEEQRARAWPILIDGPPRYAVGGFAQLTTVRRGEFSSRILRRWPDQIGEKIGGGPC